MFQKRKEKGELNEQQEDPFERTTGRVIRSKTTSNAHNTEPADQVTQKRMPAS